jgi:hypothetical protein
MKILAWIVIIFLGLVCVRVVIFLSYKIINLHAWNYLDIVAAAIGVLAALCCRATYRTLLKRDRGSIAVDK